MGKKFSGLAHGVQIREEGTAFAMRHILSFQLETGGKEKAFPVQMSGGWNKTLKGRLSEGDNLEVEGDLKSWGIEAKKIRNKTTGFELKFD